jgi:2-polyprenyl-6-methoxyphenol hydroxylase-like FAD-dependent oxidoreductase
VAASRTLVIGGGLGGLTLAHGLRAASFEVAIFERAREHPAPLNSFRILLNATGARALKSCVPVSVWNSVVEHSARAPRGFRFATEQLSSLMFLEEDFDQSYPVSRGGLRKLLEAGLEDALEYDKRLVRYELADSSVTAYFEDGTSVTGDLLVGADGSNSAVRRQLLPNAQVIDTGVFGMAGKVYITDELRAELPERFLHEMTRVVAPQGVGMFVGHSSAA